MLISSWGACGLANDSFGDVAIHVLSTLFPTASRGERVTSWSCPLGNVPWPWGEVWRSWCWWWRSIRRGAGQKGWFRRTHSRPREDIKGSPRSPGEELQCLLSAHHIAPLQGNPRLSCWATLKYCVVLLPATDVELALYKHNLRCPYFSDVPCILEGLWAHCFGAVVFIDVGCCNLTTSRHGYRSDSIRAPSEAAFYCLCFHFVKCF